MSSEEINHARRISIVLARAEEALGISSALPLKLRLIHILEGAMDQPTKVSNEAYSLAHKLSQPPPPLQGAYHEP